MVELKWNLQFHFNSGQYHFAIPIPIPELTPALFITLKWDNFLSNWPCQHDLISESKRNGTPGGGGTPKNFWRGCAAPFFDRIPLAKEILLENIPLAKENFLIMSSFLHDIKKFQPPNSLFKRNFPKTDANLAPKCHFFFLKVTLRSGTPPVRST